MACSSAYSSSVMDGVELRSFSRAISDCGVGWGGMRWDGVGLGGMEMGGWGKVG